MWVVTEPQKWGRVITGDFKASTKIIWIFEQSPLFFCKIYLLKTKSIKNIATESYIFTRIKILILTESNVYKNQSLIIDVSPVSVVRGL